MNAQSGVRPARGLPGTPWSRHIGLGIALAVLAFAAPQAEACGWWWACGDGRYAYRPAPRVNGYGSPARAYRYGRPSWAYGYRAAPWAYGYTSPARFYGDPYAAWSSTSIPSTRSYLNTATPVPNADAIGLTVPITSGQGLLEGGLPPRGPSLFGPDPPPTWAYAYGGPAYGYYGRPAYGYRAAPPRAYGAPPADTPSWWLEPRRR